MKDSFKLYSDESTIIIKGLENSKMGNHLMAKEDFRKQLIADYSLIEDKPLQLDFHLLFSGKKSEPSKNQPVIASDIRYKSILFVVTMKDGKTGWELIHFAQKPGQNLRKNTLISDFFPLQLHIADKHILYLALASSYRWIQVYEVTTNYEAIRLDSRKRESDTDSCSSAAANDQNFTTSQIMIVKSCFSESLIHIREAYSIS
jgi:hypothetical protein